MCPRTPRPTSSSPRGSRKVRCARAGLPPRLPQRRPAALPLLGLRQRRAGRVRRGDGRGLRRPDPPVAQGVRIDLRPQRAGPRPLGRAGALVGPRPGGPGAPAPHGHRPRRPRSSASPREPRVRFARLEEVDIVLPAAAAMFTDEIGYPPYRGSSRGYRALIAGLIADRPHGGLGRGRRGPVQGRRRVGGRGRRADPGGVAGTRGCAGTACPRRLMAAATDLILEHVAPAGHPLRQRLQRAGAGDVPGDRLPGGRRLHHRPALAHAHTPGTRKGPSPRGTGPSRCQVDDRGAGPQPAALTIARSVGSLA